jgi:hypothetical protein
MSRGGVLSGLVEAGTESQSVKEESLRHVKLTLMKPPSGFARRKGGWTFILGFNSWAD